jgi:hypothetical protein
LFDIRRLTGGREFDGAGAELFSGRVEPMTVGRAEQAIVTHFDESVRQDVLKKPTDKLFGGHRAGFDLIGGRVLGLKRDLVIVQRENPVVADSDAKDVGGQVFEGGLTAADRLAVNDPVLGPDALIDDREQIGLFQVISDLGAKPPTRA